MTEDNLPQTKNFNMAVSTLMRLDSILKFASENAVIGNLIMWNDALMELRRNIAPFIAEDFEDIEQKFNNLNKRIWIIQSKTGKLRVAPNEVSRVYSELDKISITMQQAMHKAGLLMPKSDNPMFAIEG